MIFCPVCTCPTLAEISTMRANRCDQCHAWFFYYFQNDVLFTAHFAGDTHVLREAQPIGEHGFEETPATGITRIFNKTQLKAFKVCAHCAEKNDGPGSLCDACREVFSISPDQSEWELATCEADMVPLIWREFPGLLHLIKSS